MGREELSLPLLPALHHPGNHTYRVILSNRSDLIVVIGSAEGGQTVRVQASACRVQLIPVVLGQLCVKRVDGDDKRSPVRLKLRIKTNSCNVTQYHNIAISVVWYTKWKCIYIQPALHTSLQQSCLRVPCSNCRSHQGMPE